MASSVTFAVVEEETFKRPRKNGLRLLGRRYEIEAFEDARSDAMCGRCSGWDYITTRCSRKTHCALCAGQHQTDQHECPPEGRLAGKGQTCTHDAAKRPNCRGQHVARVNVCPKREARRAAEGWGPPPPPPRRREGEAVPVLCFFRSPLYDRPKECGLWPFICVLGHLPQKCPGSAQ